MVKTMLMMTKEEAKQFNPNQIIDITKFYLFKNNDLVISDHKDDENVKTITSTLSSVGNKDSYGDIMLKGCFDESISDINKSGIPTLWGHDIKEIIGGWESAWMANDLLKADGELLVEDIRRAKEAVVLYKKKLCTGISIGFRSSDYTLVEDFVDGKWAGYHFEFAKVDIYEASLVAWPANKKAKINNIKMDDCLKDIRKRANITFSIEKIGEIQEFLASHGLSQSQASILVDEANFNKRVSLNKIAGLAKFTKQAQE